MIQAPEPQPKRRFETDNGYKLGGAMAWVVIGMFAGVFAALIAFGLAIASNELTQMFDRALDLCASRTFFDDLLDAFHSVAVMLAVGILLFMARKSVVRRTTPRYEEFAEDVGNWFSFGAIFAYAICGAPLVALAIFNNNC